MHLRQRTSSAFSTNGDLGSIASKEANIAVNPLQSEILIE